MSLLLYEGLSGYAFLWSYFVTLKINNNAFVQVVSYESGDLYYYFQKIIYLSLE